MMELEEMKTAWTIMSTEMEKQKKITGSLIIKMTKISYRNKINNILLPELAGTIISFAIVFFIMFNWQKLDHWYSLASGIITVLLLVIMPVISLCTVYKMRAISIAHNNCRETLVRYSKRKKQFIFTQKLGFYLGAVLMLVSLPVMAAVMDGGDIFKKTNLWLWYCIGFPFFLIFTRWVFKSYTRSAERAEGILKELEED